jgi:hypothetical protein
MDLLLILKWIIAIATILTGVFALVRPKAVQGFIGLQAQDGRGISEIRSIFGGLFIVLGFAPLILNSPVAFKMLGLAYIGIAAVRAVSIVMDRSMEKSNLISLVVEVIFGVLLVI